MDNDQIARVRRICLALPEAWEQEAWGEPTFRVKKRLFAMFANDHHGDGRIALWCNAPLGVQETLVRSEPEKYFVPPYVGVKGWVGIVLDRCSDEEVQGLVVQSYCMVAPRKLQALVGG
ncbi:MAG TPA: MmcQ/YjbR family DNA-binding protein [Longimicrobiaceae bacterium]|nr:MmcQ/YjbR family DNA-binding protein [Longimicrobiaceae bacterium]